MTYTIYSVYTIYVAPTGDSCWPKGQQAIEEYNTTTCKLLVNNYRGVGVQGKGCDSGLSPPVEPPFIPPNLRWGNIDIFFNFLLFITHI